MLEDAADGLALGEDCRVLANAIPSQRNKGRRQRLVLGKEQRQTRRGRDRAEAEPRHGLLSPHIPSGSLLCSGDGESATLPTENVEKLLGRDAPPNMDVALVIVYVPELLFAALLVLGHRTNAQSHVPELLCLPRPLPPHLRHLALHADEEVKILLILFIQVQIHAHVHVCTAVLPLFATVSIKESHRGLGDGPHSQSGTEDLLCVLGCLLLLRQLLFLCLLEFLALRHCLPESERIDIAKTFLPVVNAAVTVQVQHSLLVVGVHRSTARVKRDPRAPQSLHQAGVFLPQLLQHALEPKEHLGVLYVHVEAKEAALHHVDPVLLL
mmetsp:Transcript_11716/g.47315  ORF Transcript_11716/g.47315 Transcript_11716/m.47315 type:complete len:325 (+) Transcript_11716:445-1419(+)